MKVEKKFNDFVKFGLGESSSVTTVDNISKTRSFSRGNMNPNLNLFT